MPRGVRYSAAQKRRMTNRALKLRAEGKSQKTIADELGVAIMTLKKLLSTAEETGSGAPAAVSGRKRARRAGTSQGQSVPASSPAMQLAMKHEQLQKIEQEIADLVEKKTVLPRLLNRPTMASRNSFLINGSKPDVGSSRMSSSGL